MNTSNVIMSEQHQKDRIFAFQLPNLTKNFGFVMGIEFREGSLSITPSCHAIAAKGMVFNVNIGLSGLINKVISTYITFDDVTDAHILGRY
jgi:nucleosome binding factor SPN SPT16 subunit